MNRKIWILLTAVLFLINCPVSAKETSHPFLSATEWDNYFLIGDGVSIAYALNCRRSPAKLVAVNSTSGGTISATVVDPANQNLLFIVQIGNHQIIKVRRATSKEETIDFPPELDQAKPKDITLFIKDNKIQFILRKGLRFSYGVYEGDRWNTINIEPDIPLPSSFSRNSPLKFFFLDRKGFYCVSYSGEWGCGVVYFDFDSKKWDSCLQCHPLLSQKPIFWASGLTGKGLWVVTKDDIKRLEDGKIVSCLTMKDLNLDPDSMDSINIDSSNNLYIMNKRGLVFELVEKSLVLVTKYDESQDALIKAPPNNKLNVSLLCVGTKVILFSINDSELTLFDRKHGKFSKPLKSVDSLRL